MLWERILANTESHGTFGQELVLKEFQEEEEEVGNSEGVGKKGWEARGPMGVDDRLLKKGTLGFFG